MNIATCGHETTIDEERTVYVMRMSRECKPVPSFETLCPKCYRMPKRGGYLLETAQRVKDWQSGKILHAPW